MSNRVDTMCDKCHGTGYVLKKDVPTLEAVRFRLDLPADLTWVEGFCDCPEGKKKKKKNVKKLEKKA